MESMYCYPGTNVLKNKFGIRDQEKLTEAENNFTTFRINQLQAQPIGGNYGLLHLQAIHKHIFQDVYDWAGKIREVNIAKGNTMFANPLYIKPYSDKLFSDLSKENYLKGLGIEKFSERLSYYAAEINMLHPFREGNGRTIREYIRYLAKQAGYSINYSKIPIAELYNAFVKSVQDCEDLSSILKKHFIENIRNSYKEQYIKNAPESLISKLNDIRLIYSDDGSYLTVDTIKQLYKEAGSIIDNNAGLKNADFSLLSDVVNELKLIQARGITNNRANEIDTARVMKIEME
jgi:cell filamentation protein